MVSSHIALLVAAFALIWFSSGLVIDAVESTAKKLRLTPFSFSFIFLGLFTSVSEAIIGLTAVVEGQPTIFIGNLLGATLVLFGLVLPLLALFGGGIRFRKELTPLQLILSLCYIVLPAVALLDGSVTMTEGWMLFLGYPLLLLFVKVRRQSVIGVLWGNLRKQSFSPTRQTLRLLAGLGLLWVASHLLIEQVVWISTQLSTTPFIVSLLLLSIGSNLPELIVAIQSILKKQTIVAYGNYLGSAIANTLAFGILTVFHGKTIHVSDGLTFILPSIVILVALFYFFLRSNKGLSRLEGTALLTVYLLYVIAEWQLR